MKNKYGFTLTELILGVSISAVVLLVVFSFMANVMNDFGKSRKKTEFITTFYEFSAKVDEYKAVFENGSIIDGAGGSDVLFLYTPGGNGVIFGVVDDTTLRLDATSQASIYGSKHMGYKELTVSQVSQVLGYSASVYNYNFFRDKVFQNIYMKDFQVTSYNTGSLFHADIDILIYYKDALDGSSMDNLIGDDIFSTVLTF